MAEEEQTYLLGALERRAAIAGFRPGQVAAAGTGATCAAALLAASTSPPALVGSIALAALGIAAASIPVRGRSVDEWLPSLIGYLRRRARRQVLEVEILEGPRGVGVIRQPGGRLSASLRLDSAGIALLDAATRARRVDGFAAALGMLAREGGCVDRAQWTIRAERSGAASALADLRARGELGTPAALRYRELLEELGDRGTERSLLLTLRTTGSRPEEAASLVDELDAVAQALEDAGHRPCRALLLDELAEELAARGAEVVGASASLDVASQLRTVAVDGLRHVSWWISAWPRQAVTAELLAPLLLADESRTAAVVVEPVRPSAALRRAAARRTSEVADAELRRRAGFLADRRQQRRSHQVERREAELVDGFGSLRISGFVAVAVPEGGEIQSAAAEVELAAAQAQLELRRLEGDHARGLLATWPLAGGLP